MKTLPVALQLYTVREEMAKNVSKTLEAVKEMGYDYVEPAGLYTTYEEFTSELNRIGLKAISAHVPFADTLANPDDVLDHYKAMGCEYFVVPYLEDGKRPGNEGFEGVLADIDRLGGICAGKGLTLLYHNHDFEFCRMPDGRYGLDYMYDSISPAHLQTELDTCWVKVGGEDPAEYIRKYAGRCPVVHLKDFNGSKSENMYELIGQEKKAAPASGGEFKLCPVGSGRQDFPSVLQAAVESGAKYVVVEQDGNFGTSCLDDAKKSRDYLKTLGW